MKITSARTVVLAAQIACEDLQCRLAQEDRDDCQIQALSSSVNEAHTGLAFAHKLLRDRRRAKQCAALTDADCRSFLSSLDFLSRTVEQLVNEDVHQDDGKRLTVVLGKLLLRKPKHRRSQTAQQPTQNITQEQIQQLVATFEECLSLLSHFLQQLDVVPGLIQEELKSIPSPALLQHVSAVTARQPTKTQGLATTSSSLAALPKKPLNSDVQSQPVLVYREQKTIRETLLPIRKWLSPHDHTIDHTRVMARMSSIRTGEWLLDDASYRDWKGGTLSKPLWINAEPGLGKTSLCSTIVEDLQTLTTTHDCVLAYYYVSSASNYESVLRSFLLQMADHETARQVLGSAFDRSNSEMAPRFELEALLEAQVASLPLVYIVIDALDECPGGLLRREMLSGLSKLASMDNVRMLTTSRPVADIERSMHANHCISYPLPLPKVGNDIGRWIEAQFVLEDKFSEELQTLIRSSLLIKANGMFQYAILAFNNLNVSQSPTPYKVKKALDNLPKGMNETYDRILQKIVDEDRLEAITSLKWLAFAHETLSLQQLAETTYLTIGVEPGYDADFKPEPYNIWRLIEDLVTVDHTTGEWGERKTTEVKFYEAKRQDIDPVQLSIRFNHGTIKEYLTSQYLKQGELNAFYLAQGRSYCDLAQACLSTLILLQDASDANDERDIGMPEVAFDSFLVVHAYKYAMQYQREAEQALDYVPLLEDDFVLRFLHNPRMSFFHQGLTPLYSAAEAGLTRSLRVLGDRDINMVMPDQIASTPLIAAAAQGYKDTVSILIEMGADPNLEAGLLGTALYAAASSNHFEVVRELLNECADPNHISSRSRYGAALIVASASGHLDIVRLLIERNAKINICQADGTTALHAACLAGHTQVARFLVDCGADVNAFSAARGTPLHEAATKSRVDCARLLLEHGARHDIVHEDKGAPLHHAIERAWDTNTATLALLLQNGSDANSTYGWKKTPLMHAIEAEAGSKEAVSLLLQHKVRVDIRDQEGRTPSTVARSRGNLDVLEMLDDAATTRLKEKVTASL